MNNAVMKNGFDTAASNQPVGDLLKWVKVQFLRSGSPVALGTVFVALMPTLQAGSIGWTDQVISYLPDYVSRIGIPPVESGFSPFTNLLLLDEAGAILTFSSSSWGGRNCCTALIPQFRLMGQSMLPTIALGSKPRVNQYGAGTDPAFVVTGWTARAKFSAILGPEPAGTPALAAPAPAPGAEPVPSKTKATASKKRSASEIVDDALPF